MKILAVICNDCENDVEPYGYSIWQQLKTSFYVYMNDNDIRNVYHHLNDLCALGYIAKSEGPEDCPKCFYDLTPQGHGVRHRYQKFIDILNMSPS
jgi:DNA-binding PadR family transcriptional regulator